jgi:hypothetical protein
MVASEWVVQHLHSAREQDATNRAHGIFKGRHFEATLILQAVSHGPLRSIPVTLKGVHTDREQHQTVP